MNNYPSSPEDRADDNDMTMADFFLSRLHEANRQSPGFPITPRGTASYLDGIATVPQAESVAESLIMQLVQAEVLKPAPDKFYSYGDWLPYYMLILPGGAGGDWEAG
jgi:hypothetical protein